MKLNPGNGELPAPLTELSVQTILSLARTRVYERLESALDFPILVVNAPAGFGKSTVLREFFALRGHAHRRLVLTRKHGDLLAFMRALATCLSDVAPALLTSFMGIYDRVNGDTNASSKIADWAAGHLGAAGVSVMIDGLENAADERLFRLLTELVDRTSGTALRWILVAQTATEFPIARWLADNRMDVPIDDVDLALTFDDFAQTLALHQCSMTREELRARCTSAANWPAAVALLLGDPVTLAQSDCILSQRRPYPYFASRAFLARTGFEQRFLLETCLYTSFDRELLAAAGWHDVEATLKSLLDAGAFIFVDVDGAYRYHEVFRSFLEQRLQSSAAEIDERIRAATANVCRRVGRWSDALELYSDLHEATALGSLLSEYGFELMDRGEADMVSRGLASLGEADFAAFPVALALKASLESLTGSFDVAEAWFRHAIKNVSDASQRGAIVFRFATDLVRRDRRDAIDLLQPIVAEAGHELKLAVSLAGLLATAYATHHMDVEAARTIESALQLMTDVNDTTIRAKLYFQAGYVAFFACDFARAKSFAQRALDTALKSHLYDIAARALSILYNVAMDHEDDMPATRACLEQLASCSMKAGSRHLLMYATLGQYEIEVLSGNLVESARLDETLKSLEVDYSVIATETLLPAQALRATWSGDFDRAYRLIAPTAEKQITQARRAQRYAEIAVYAAAAGLRREAAAAASRALTIAPKSAPTDKAVTLSKAFVALALTLLGRHARATRILLELSDSAKLTPRLEQLITAIRTLNDRWTRGRYTTELRAVLDRLDDSDFGGIGRLIEALPLPETFRGKLTLLSDSERQVLQHLANGLSPSEVATRLGRSPEAMEECIISFCRKLGCTGPRHAVALLQSDNERRTAAVYGE